MQAKAHALLLESLLAKKRVVSHIDPETVKRPHIGLEVEGPPND